LRGLRLLAYFLSPLSFGPISQNYYWYVHSQFRKSHYAHTQANHGNNKEPSASTANLETMNHMTASIEKVSVMQSPCTVSFAFTANPLLLPLQPLLHAREATTYNQQQQ
jgi:hypothetical protein